VALASDISERDGSVRAVIEVSLVTQATSSSPMTDAAGRTTHALDLSAPPVRYAIHAGYTDAGAFAYNQVALDPPGDPRTSAVSRIREVRVRGGAVYLYDASGRATLGTASGEVGLHRVLGTTDADPLGVLGGVVLSALPSPGMQTSRDGGSVSVTAVREEAGRVTIEGTLVSPDPADGPSPYRRVYARQSDGRYALSEARIAVNEGAGGVQLDGELVIRVEQLAWTEYAGAPERSGSAVWGAAANRAPSVPPWCQSPSPDGGTVDTDPLGQCPDAGGGGHTPPSNPNPPTCAPVAGGANVAYVHGILSDGGAWGDPTRNNQVRGRLRCRLQVAHDMAPSLSLAGGLGLGSHADQATVLRGEVIGSQRSDHILVGHSQGGLISRRAAQAFAADEDPGRVRAVVTVGTPHHGAFVAEAASTTWGLLQVIGPLNTVDTRYGSNAVCALLTQPGCRLVRDAATSLAVSFLGAIALSPAMHDLTPTSVTLSGINAVAELFPRYGIQHYIDQRFAFVEVGGDLFPGNPGRGARAAVELAHNLSLAGAFIGVVLGFLGAPWAVGVSVHLIRAVFAANAADAAWKLITARTDPRSDGVVQGASQVYPGALLNRASLDPSSHTAQNDSERSAEDIFRVLRDDLGVLERN